MKPIALVLLLLPLIVGARPAHAQDSFQNVAFFYPLRTRRPVIERELEFHVEHAKGAAGRTTEAAAAIELPIMPRWQVEVEVPFVFNDPRDGTAQGGVGDLSLETKVAVWQSLDWLSQIAVGVEGRFPTGSERRGLGGKAAVEPFVTGGIALGDFDLLASVYYEFILNANVDGALRGRGPERHRHRTGRQHSRDAPAPPTSHTLESTPVATTVHSDSNR